MLYLYILLGLFVPIIALFKRELLVQRNSSRLILVISVLLFVAGIAIHFSGIEHVSAYGALLAPVLSFGLFKALRKLFLRKLHREPRDTYLDWSPNLGWDRIFNIVYFTLTAWLVLSTMIGVRVLTKAGW